MNKIKWTPKGSSKYARAQVGCIRMHCYMHFTQMAKPRWYAYVSLDYRAYTRRYGKMRHSLVEAKGDAVRMGHELLLDWNAALEAELANYEKKTKLGQ